MKRMILEFFAFCLMMFLTLLVAVMLGACGGGGGGSSTPAVSVPIIAPIPTSPSGNTFVWGVSKWGEGEWK